MPLACTKGMTLGTTRLEKLSSGLGVTYTTMHIVSWNIARGYGLTGCVRHRYWTRVWRREVIIRGRGKVVGRGGRVAGTWMFKKGPGVADPLSGSRVYP